MQANKLSHITEKFEAITLQEMDSVKLMNRVDTKFILSLKRAQKLLPELIKDYKILEINGCLLYTSPSPRDATLSRMPSSA